MNSYQALASDMKINHRQAAILHAFLQIAPSEIFKRIQANCCLASVRIAQQVLDAYHIRVEPLSVKVIVENSAYTTRAMKEQRHVKDMEELAEWHKEDGSYRWQIDDSQIGEGTWRGHAVAVVNGQFAMEIALAQLNNVDTNIILQPVVFRLPGGFAYAPDDGSAVGVMVRACRVLYMPRPSNDGWKTHPHWQRPQDYKEIVESIRGQMPSRRILDKIGKKR